MFFSAHLNFQILGFFPFRPLKAQKLHCLISDIAVHGISIFSANYQGILKIFFIPCPKFSNFGIFRFRPPKNTKGQWFDFCYPCAYIVHNFS